MLLVAATPIGNVDDASTRLRKAFTTADLICAEDTRRTRDLIKRLELEVRAEITALHDHNEASRVEGVITKLKAGDTVLVVSDAGMPTVSDPGFKLINRAIAEDIEMSCLPGPSAVLTALALSGLPTHNFYFEGFLPPKSGSRQNRLQVLKNINSTLIFFESTHRIQKTLQDISAVFGEQTRAALCRELTKTHEEVIRLPIGELSELASQRDFKGEMVVVIDGRYHHNNGG